MSKANEICQNASLLDDTEKVVLSKEDFTYLVRMAEALEKINQIQNKVYAGEIDGFDFGEEVEQVLMCV